VSKIKIGRKLHTESGIFLILAYFLKDLSRVIKIIGNLRFSDNIRTREIDFEGFRGSSRFKSFDDSREVLRLHPDDTCDHWFSIFLIEYV
jgi:hypothetical protein